MNTALVGLIGLYAVGVGLHGNADAAGAEIVAEAQGFVPWLLAVIVLRIAYNSATLKPFVGPFIGLAILVYIIKNYKTFGSQINQIAGRTIVPGA